MIICSESFSVPRCISLADDEEGMNEYVLSLIPKIYQHNTSLISNQKYYMNTIILKDKTIPLDKKIAISNTLMHNVNVCGYLDTFISIQGVERFINNDKLIKLRKEDS